MMRRALPVLILLAAGAIAAHAQDTSTSGRASSTTGNTASTIRNTTAVPTSGATASVPALHAARDLPRGIALAAADVTADSSADFASIAGWVTRRVVRRGEALREPTIAPPQLVRAGAAVRVQANIDGILVAREGIALAPGGLGDRIRVRLDTQRTITGIVAGPATISLP